MEKRYGVDVGAIVRTVPALGYERYADFIADLTIELEAHIQFEDRSIFKARIPSCRQCL